LAACQPVTVGGHSSPASSIGPVLLTPLRRNAIANIVGRTATALLWIAVTPYVLSRLGADRFGVWALFFAFTYYVLVLDLGVGSTMIYFIAAQSATGDRKALTRTLGRGLRFALGLGLFWAMIIALCRGWIATAFHVPAAMIPETLSAMLVFAIGVFLLFPAQMMLGALQGFERLDLSNLCMFLGVAAQVLALYVALVAGGDLRAVAAAGVFGQAVTGAVAWVMLRQQLRELRPGKPTPGPTWRDLLHFGAALQVTGFLIVFQLQLGKIMLGLLGNLSMVTNYELASRVASGVAGLPILLLGAVVPAVSRAWETEGPEAVGEIFTFTLRWLYTQSVIALGLLWLLAPDIIHLWVGAAHQEVASLIRLWAVAFAVNYAWSAGAAVARGVGKPWIEVAALLGCAIVNIALCFWWVPRYGTAGAVAGLGVSYTAGFLIFLVASRRSGIPYGPWLRRELAPRMVAGGLAIALCVGLLALGTAHMPPLGWSHAALVTAVFMSLFALFFLPLGDTQRLSRILWQLTTGTLARLRRS
jgi:O-antigen/teichoic acid export membrane protein